MGIGLAVGIVVGLVTIGVLLTIAAIRSLDRGERVVAEPDEMFTLGIVFFGAGIALFISVGPAMIGLPALGVIFVVVGAARGRTRN